MKKEFSLLDYIKVGDRVLDEYGEECEFIEDSSLFRGEFCLHFRNIERDYILYTTKAGIRSLPDGKLSIYPKNNKNMLDNPWLKEEKLPTFDHLEVLMLWDENEPISTDIRIGNKESKFFYTTASGKLGKYNTNWYGCCHVVPKEELTPQMIQIRENVIEKLKSREDE